jgi:hypothetical protein
LLGGVDILSVMSVIVADSIALFLLVHKNGGLINTRIITTKVPHLKASA